MPTVFHDRRPANKQAEYLQGTSLHGKGDTRAVVWTKPQEGQEKGARYEGSHVSPTKTGVRLHGAPGGTMHFANEAVHSVNYVGKGQVA
jgi:hypothetical protein